MVGHQTGEQPAMLPWKSLRESEIKLKICIWRGPQAPAEADLNMYITARWAMLRLAATQIIESLHLQGRFYQACQGVSEWLGPLDELAPEADSADLQLLMTARILLRVVRDLCYFSQGQVLRMERTMLFFQRAVCRALLKQDLCLQISTTKLTTLEEVSLSSHCHALVQFMADAVKEHAASNSRPLLALLEPDCCDSLTAIANVLRTQPRCCKVALHGAARCCVMVVPACRGQHE